MVYARVMPRDRIADEIHELLRQPLGAVASRLASAWLETYRTQALAAARSAAPEEGRQAAIDAARAELSRKLREILPAVIDLELLFDREVSAAACEAVRTCRRRFEQLLSATPGGAEAERRARAELAAFRQRLERDLEDRIARLRTRLHDSPHAHDFENLFVASGRRTYRSSRSSAACLVSPLAGAAPGAAWLCPAMAFWSA